MTIIHVFVSVCLSFFNTMIFRAALFSSQKVQNKYDHNLCLYINESKATRNKYNDHNICSGLDINDKLYPEQIL